MMNNKFEKRIQEKLNQFEVQPSENLLENIFEKRAARSKGAFNFSYFKLGVAVLSLAIIAVAIIVNQGPSVKEAGLSGIQQNADLANNKVADNKAEGKAEIDQANSTISEPAMVENVAKTSEDHSVNRVSETKRIFSPVAKKSISHVKEVNAVSKEVNAIKGVSKSEDISNKKNNISKYVAVKNAIDENEVYNDNGYNIEERYFNVDAKDRPRIASVANNGNSHLIVYHSVEANRFDNLGLNYMLIKPMRVMPLDRSGSEQLALINYQSTKAVVKNRKPIYVDVLFAPVLSLDNVKGNNVNEGYQSMARSNFNKQYNLRVSYPVSDKINVFVGFGYMNLSTKFKGDFEHSEAAVRYETVTNYINDPVLGTIAVTHIDTINFVKNDPLKYNFKNTYQIINLPVGLSYNFGVKNFDFALNGSAVFNIYSSAKGSNADFANYRTTTFDSDKKHLGLGAGISFMAAYKLTNRLRLIVEPGFQYFKINSQKNGNIVNEKVLNNGLNIGLRYTLY